MKYILGSVVNVGHYIPWKYTSYYELQLNVDLCCTVSETVSPNAPSRCGSRIKIQGRLYLLFIYLCLYVCIYLFIYYILAWVRDYREPAYLSDIVLGNGLDDQRFVSRQGLGIFLFTTVSYPALWPTQPRIQWYHVFFL